MVKGVGWGNGRGEIGGMKRCNEWERKKGGSEEWGGGG